MSTGCDEVEAGSGDLMKMKVLGRIFNDRWEDVPAVMRIASEIPLWGHIATWWGNLGWLQE